MANRKPIFLLQGQSREMGAGDSVPIANGGTGATTADTARTNLGTPALNGFENRTDSALAMNSANLEVSKTGSGFNIWTNGTKYAYTTTQSVVVATDQALHYVYFNTSGVLSVSTSAWDITSDNVPVATVYKDGTTYAIQDERHNYKRNREWHKWAHDTIGTRYENGLTGTFGNSSLSIVQGEIHDEDVNYDTGGTKTACRLWYRHTGAATLRFENNISTPYKAITGALQYDNGGALAAVDTNKYCCNYIYVAAIADYPIQVVVGQTQHTTLAAAQSEALPTIPMTTVEWKLLYKVIYRNVGGTPTYIEAADYRTVSTGPAMTAIANSHASLINRDAADSHPQAAITGLTTADSPTFAGLVISGSNGIKLPAAPGNSGVNVLDCYEEGTWTPEFSYSVPGTFSTGYSIQSGKYTRIGNCVNFVFMVRLSAPIKGTASGYPQVSLPFFSSVKGTAQVSFRYFPIQQTPVTGLIGPNVNYIMFTRSVALGEFIPIDDPVNTTIISSSGIYFV